jgi:hypothetical protein
VSRGEEAAVSRGADESDVAETILPPPLLPGCLALGWLWATLSVVPLPMLLERGVLVPE